MILSSEEKMVNASSYQAKSDGRLSLALLGMNPDRSTTFFQILHKEDAAGNIKDTKRLFGRRAGYAVNLSPEPVRRRGGVRSRGNTG
jgi:hypothetical protein